MYTHILFDMDDTILDFQKAQLASFKYVLEKYGTFIYFFYGIPIITFDTHVVLKHFVWIIFEIHHWYNSGLSKSTASKF